MFCPTFKRGIWMKWQPRISGSPAPTHLAGLFSPVSIPGIIKKRPSWRGDQTILNTTLPETNIALGFQPSIFRCELLVSGRVKCNGHFEGISERWFPLKMHGVIWIGVSYPRSLSDSDHPATQSRWNFCCKAAAFDDVHFFIGFFFPGSLCFNGKRSEGTWRIGIPIMDLGCFVVTQHCEEKTRNIFLVFIQKHHLTSCHHLSQLLILILKLGRFGCLPSNNPPPRGFPFNKGMWGKCSGFWTFR